MGCLTYFNQLLGKKMPKLLGNYGIGNQILVSISYK